MKKFLIIATCLVSTYVFAQELFPELAGVGGQQRKAAPVSVQAPSVSEETLTVTAEENIPDVASVVDGTQSENEEITTVTEIEQPADLFAAPAPQEAPSEPQEEEQEEEDDGQQRITIYLDNAKATITPNRNFSYCFGLLKFLNTLKRPVLALDIVLKYNNLTTGYNIRDLQPNVEQIGSFSLVGDACERILDMPTVTIKTCRVEDMEEATCKKKVEFIPLRRE
ncbi:MAG: hypothetical protein II938_00190 [Alphaproteobacteria bacterium]|nr:hypothetical protein [Alphaproteobacteria bacterium]